ncbi:MAG TPA: tetratricopeptide repeat protein, partial [Blastocatellia bacterium]|nr:tetratricopeptide repeat protein [Blastocatellia bacterium]
MIERAGRFYEFGPFRLKPRQRLLLRDGEVVPLPPKAIDLLVALVEDSGNVIGKEELMKRVWPDSFVEEANLSHHVFTLRKALGEDKGGGLFIETIPRRGYRFVAEVTEAGGEADELVVAEHSRSRITIEHTDESSFINDGLDSARTARVPALPAVKSRRPVLLPLACCAAAAVVTAGAYLWKTRSNRGNTTAGVKSIAVLPFKPLVEDGREEELEIGIAESLIARLSNLRELTVRPTSAVRKYTDLQQDAIAAGRELQVESVLDASIQKSGDRLRVVARLVSIKDGKTLWADRFDERFTDIFAVEDRISERMTAALAVKLTGEERRLLAKRYTDNVDAYQLYLKGRFFWAKFTEDGLKKSIGLFEQATEKDPDYALAYTGLAAAYMVLGVNGHMAPGDTRPKAQYAVTKALELDTNLAMAHQSLAGFKLFHEWDWPGAEREFKRAIELDPGLAETHNLYSYLLSEQARFDEALAELRTAQELDPVSLGISGDYGDTLRQAGRYDQAIQQLNKTLEMDANNFFAHYSLGLACSQKGMHEQAIAEMKKAVSLSGGSARMLSGLGQAYALSGKKAEARKAIADLQALSKQRYVSPLYIAMVYATLGEKDQAFAWLEKAYDERSSWLIELAIESCWDKIRTDP